MIELTEQQQRDLEKGQGKQPQVYDPRTRITYVLVPTEVYERLQTVLEENVCATAELVDKVMAGDDANDPYLEEYQRLYGENQS